MFRSNPIIHRFIDFYFLPNCYFEIIKIKECKKTRLAIVHDLIKLFFWHKTFPDNYGPCRLWEVDQSYWKFYYGSNYQAYQRSKLLQKVQPAKYRILFDDKVVCARLCREAGVSVPHVYGIITPGQNYKEKLLSWFENSKADSFFIKPVTGCGGRGALLAIKKDHDIFIQTKTKLISIRDFNLLESSVVLELVLQDKRMSIFSSSSVNTIRVVTMFTKNESVIILAASMRCGVGESYVDNWSAGGVAVGINCKFGKLEKSAYDKRGNIYFEHPTSKVVFENFEIPGWHRIIEVSKIIQKAFSLHCCMLGMDIAVGQNGEPIVIEVNQSPDLMFQEQTSGPLLQDKINLRAFGDYDLLVNRYQKELYRKLNK